MRGNTARGKTKAKATVKPNSTKTKAAISRAATDKTSKSGAAAARKRAALVETLWEGAMLQMQDIVRRLGEGGRDPSEQERDARATAALVKVLRDLDSIDANGKAEPEHDEDDGPRDIDDFRRELARRMDEIAARRTEGNPDDPAAGAA
jgi:hypothetical protein